MRQDRRDVAKCSIVPELLEAIKIKLPDGVKKSLAQLILSTLNAEVGPECAGLVVADAFADEIADKQRGKPLRDDASGVWCGPGKPLDGLADPFDNIGIDGFAD